MGIKRYVLLTLVYMLGIGLYVYSFNGESYTFEFLSLLVYKTSGLQIRQAFKFITTP